MSHVSVLLPVFIVVREKSVLTVGVAEDLLESLKIPDGDKVEVEESEPEKPGPPMVLVEMPQVVDRIFYSLPVDERSYLYCVPFLMRVTRWMPTSYPVRRVWRCPTPGRQGPGDGRWLKSRVCFQ